ncbi:MAG: CHASE2 domain-containing protein, partial [Flammeovirgaceae bacterium]
AILVFSIHFVEVVFNCYHIAECKFKNGDNDFTFDNDAFGRYFKVISVNDLLTENFDKKDLTDKIVLMGHVSDKEDSFYLDDKRAKRISGVEIHASIIKEILD